MALFDDLFNEAAEVNTPVDYLKDLPLAKFAENMSLIECGSRGLVLAEAGWMEICESVNNFDFVNEEADLLVEAGIKDAVGAVKDAAGKAGTKVVAFMKKVPEILKRIAQNIFGTINKFLTAVSAIVKKDQNLLDADKAIAGLNNYNKVNKEKMAVSGFMFERAGAPAQDQFRKALERAKNHIEKFSMGARQKSTAGGENTTYDNTSKLNLQNDVRRLLVGDTPANGPVTSKSFMVDMKASFGKKYSKADKYEVTPEMVQLAVKAVKAGYKDEMNLARMVYKNTKEAINKWIDECHKIEKQFSKAARGLKGEENANYKEYDKKQAQNAEIAGSAMVGVSGIISSYTGTFCSLLHQQYSTYRSILVKCTGFSKGDKVYNGKDKENAEPKNESTIENSNSLFGLDLI